MNLYLSSKAARGYKSPSQKMRVITESWVNSQIYCPSCGISITKYGNNKPVADFYCANCREEFELKSKKNELGNKIVDGAYRTMIERLESDNNPNFFLLNYAPRNLEIVNFFIIPKHFFLPEIIERRKPLSDTARRAGWIGCNILLKGIPASGRIFYIKNGKPEKKADILKNWSKTLFLRESKNTELKGWIMDVMNCIDMFKKEFSLQEIYNFKNQLSSKHPNNKHIEDKIRQQLQFLRDKGYVEFLGKGRYRRA
ncbi:MAG: DpnI domain-containing protein [Candidatus Omnitrophota bacterium]|jgi:type II restriction enzyme